MLHKSDTSNRYLYWTLGLHATRFCYTNKAEKCLSELLLKLITCCLFLDFASNNLQTTYITRGPHKTLLNNTVFYQQGDNRRIDMQWDSRKMSKESSTIQSWTHELKMQSELSGDRQCSFSILLGMSTRPEFVNSYFRGFFGNYNSNLHYFYHGQCLSDEENGRHYNAERNAAFALILISSSGIT